MIKSQYYLQILITKLTTLHKINEIGPIVATSLTKQEQTSHINRSHSLINIIWSERASEFKLTHHKQQKVQAIELIIKKWLTLVR